MIEYFRHLTASVLALLVLVQAGPPAPVHLVSSDAGVDIDTAKVLQLEGEVNPLMLVRVVVSMALTEHIPGPRIILINSPGGYVDTGNEIIKRIEAEQAKGVPQVCVITGDASSMAFDILTRCDIRVAVVGGTAMFHVAASAPIDCEKSRCTPMRLQIIAEELRIEDEPFRQANAKALSLTLWDYDSYAAEDYEWSAPELIKLGYLKGFATIAPSGKK